jgi:nicotinate-nucleotide adenylyltransferase
MSIVIFGGSFDPVHNGHFEIVQNSLKKLKNVEKLIILPTFLSAFKKQSHISSKKRYFILKKVFKSLKKVYVSDFEVKQKKVVYTIESIKFFRKKYTSKKIYLLIGAENIIDKCLWKDYKKLLSMVEIIVVPRNKIKIIKNDNYKRLNFYNNISSTYIRKNNSLRDIPIKARWIINNKGN